MGKVSAIEWTDATWNPIRGCSRVSEGCRNCYAESIAARFSGPGRAYEGLAEFRVIGEGKPEERVEPHWTGEIRFIEEHLADPLRWKQPHKIFVNSMSDLFHPGVRAEWLADIFDVMARAPWHTYIMLTKRIERMQEALRAAAHPDVAAAFQNTYSQAWPPPNWWFGVSIEDQDSANHRLPILAACPAAVRFISYEPALGPVDFGMAMGGEILFSIFDWVICGGESGPHARPMKPEWARAARDQCQAGCVPFFFKQWGEFLPGDQENPNLNASPHRSGEFDRIGKKAAGAILDGIEWKEFPDVERVAHA